MLRAGSQSALVRARRRRVRAAVAHAPPEAWGLRARVARSSGSRSSCCSIPTIASSPSTGAPAPARRILAIAAGLEQVVEQSRYERLAVYRPLVPVGRADVGFLPGGLDEKLDPWMAAIHDAVVALTDRGSSDDARNLVDELTTRGQLSLESVTFLRGRSLQRQFVVIDEAQNLEPTTLRTILTRVGEGTKVIFTGDTSQIDAPVPRRVEQRPRRAGIGLRAASAASATSRSPPASAATWPASPPNSSDALVRPGPFDRGRPLRLALTLPTPAGPTRVSHPVSRVDRVTLPRFAVVDLETSGFSTRRHRILQVGLVTVESDGTVVDEWSTLVKLRWPLQRVGPTHVHGITRRTLKGAPPLDDVLAEFGERLDGAIFTAHNADFDGGFLAPGGTSPARRRPGPPESRAPAVHAAACPAGSTPTGNVRTAWATSASTTASPSTRPHDALADAAATAAILPHLLADLDINEVDEFEPFYRPAR